MEIYVFIGGTWVALATLYGAWPYLHMPSVRLRRRHRDVESLIGATSSFHVEEPEVARRFEREVEEAVAVLERPVLRRAPGISETVPSQAPLTKPRRPVLSGTFAESQAAPRRVVAPAPEPVRAPAYDPAPPREFLRDPEPEREPVYSYAASTPVQPYDDSPFEAQEQRYETHEPAFVTAINASLPVVAEMSEELEFLRAQVEQLREELEEALTQTPVPQPVIETVYVAPMVVREPVQRPERVYLRRYRTGAYTQLPRSLRQQVNVARSRRVHV